jgi:ribosomal protein S12 methylthiotransferase
MAVQEGISLTKLDSRVGKRLTVLIDEPGRGRSAGDAPEIDGVVQFKEGNARGAKAGELRDVLIERSDAHDLFGRLQ